jgi:TfoX/Sxy family transcriptional regulator of competence genes
MATDNSIVDFILEQTEGAGKIRAKKMFGEYGLYCNEKIVALICDDQLFVKPTAGGRTHIGEILEAPPYPGAKPYFLISGEKWDNAEWLTALIKITAAELPTPKPKPPAKKQSRESIGRKKTAPRKNFFAKPATEF